MQNIYLYCDGGKFRPEPIYSKVQIVNTKRSELSSRKLAERKLFVRDATGLVKEFSTTDTFTWSVCNVPILLSFVNFMFWTTTSGVLGVNYIVTVLVWMVASGVLVLAYYILGVAMPRTGGDYTWSTRALPPVVGFLMSWLLVTGNFFSEATGPYGGIVYLSSGLSLVGKMMNDAGLQAFAGALTQQSWELFIGIGTLVLAGIACLFGKRLLKAVIWLIFIMGAAGLLVTLGLLIGVSRGDYVSSFNGISGLAYDQVLSTAQSSGLAQAATIGASLSAFPFAVYTLGPQQTMTWMGGEVKSPQRTLLYGMVGAWAVSGVLWLIMFGLLDSTVGTRFVEAMNFLSVNNPSAYAQTGMPAGVNPSLISLLLLTRNPWLMMIITLGVFVGNMGWIIITVPVTARVLFAWAFDRLAPTKFAHVSDRYGTPTYAISLVVAGSIFLYVILLVNPTVFVVNGSVLTAITYTIVGIAAAVFAYTRKDIFERSPVKAKIANIPILSILGVVMVVIYAYMAYESLSNPNIGNLSTPALVTALGFVILAPILFYLSAAVRKRQGIDLKMVFKEIPPE